MTTATSRLVLRLAGAFAVGCVLAPVCAVAVVGAAFGGGALAVGAAAVAVAMGCFLLAAIHQVTGTTRPERGLSASLGWGLIVTVGSAALVMGCALAWSTSGRSFGSSALGWWLLSGVGTALIAAVGTRRTAVPAGAVALLLVVGAIAVSGAGRELRWSGGDDSTSGTRPSLVYVVDLPGYDTGQQTSGSSSPAIVYLPVGAPPLDGTGPDPSVLVTTEDAAADTSPAPCGRNQQLPFDDANVATCVQLGPGLFHREATRYHEVVRVEGDVVVSATAAEQVPLATLEDAVRTARPATDAELDRLYRGWGQP